MVVMTTFMNQCISLLASYSNAAHVGQGKFLHTYLAQRTSQALDPKTKSSLEALHNVDISTVRRLVRELQQPTFQPLFSRVL